MYSFGERHYKTTRVYELILDTHSTSKSGLWACFLDPGMLSSPLASPSCHSEAPFPWRHCWSFHLPSQFEPKLGALPLRLPASPLHHCHSYTCIIDASCNILEGRTAPYSLHLCVPSSAWHSGVLLLRMQSTYIIANDSLEIAISQVLFWRLQRPTHLTSQ